MAALDKGVLELTADVDGDGSTETGVFHLTGNGEIVHEVTKDYIFDNTASGLVSLISLLNEFELSKRKGFYADIGAGAHIFEFNHIAWDGTEAPQWGDGSGTFPADATDEDPFSKMQCLDRYATRATTDSFAPATLHVGEYTDGSYGPTGAFDPLKVALQDPRETINYEEPGSVDINLTCVEVQPLDEAIDLTQHAKRGRTP
jgi:hypothetical protein